MRVTNASRLGAVGALLSIAACVEDPQQPNAIEFGPAHAIVAPPGASVNVQVQVPASMTAAPFNVTRTLTVPPNFTIAVYARVPGARFLAVTPDGNLLVSHPGGGRVRLVRPNAGGDPLIVRHRAPPARHRVPRHERGHVPVHRETHQINRYVYRRAI
jgi:glucose/arabinose dehydrogenase